MASFMGLETKERETVNEPEGITLLKGYGWTGAGLSAFTGGNFLFDGRDFPLPL